MCEESIRACSGKDARWVRASLCRRQVVPLYATLDSETTRLPARSGRRRSMNGIEFVPRG